MNVNSKPKDESIEEILRKLKEISNDNSEMIKVLQDIRSLLRYGSDGKKSG
jgi:hypothetical protein